MVGSVWLESHWPIASFIRPRRRRDSWSSSQLAGDRTSFPLSNFGPRMHPPWFRFLMSGNRHVEWPSAWLAFVENTEEGVPSNLFGLLADLVRKVGRGLLVVARGLELAVMGRLFPLSLAMQSRRPAMAAGSAVAMAFGSTC